MTKDELIEALAVIALFAVGLIMVLVGIALSALFPIDF
jgi:hypothetical protein